MSLLAHVLGHAGPHSSKMKPLSDGQLTADKGEKMMEMDEYKQEGKFA